jgi:hypothetical protein
MKLKPALLPKPIIFITFGVGILCAVGFRSLIILDKVNPALVRAVWYFSVVGYIYFFAFRYYIAEKRKNIIKQSDLLRKISEKEELTDNDREVLSYVLSSIIKSKESANYFFIFFTSIIAIILDLFIIK